MKKIRYKQGTAVVLALLLMINAWIGYIDPSIESLAYTERAAKINATNLNVRSEPGTGNSVVAKLSHGTSVTIINEKRASDGVLWYQIRFSGSNGAMTTGYVRHDFVQLPVDYKPNADFEAYLNTQGFPESYKPGLRQLHARYPNWVFKAQHTNLDWNTVIENESILPRSLVHNSSISSWKSTAEGAFNWDNSTWPGFDGKSWVAASDGIIRYYMDPRNFLDDTYVFQFLLQSYDGSAQTAQGLETMVKGTFLESKATGGSGNTGTGGSGSSGPGASGPGISGPGVSGPGVSEPGVNAGNGSNSGPGVAKPGGDDEVRLQGPGASVSRNNTNLTATSIGPGMTGGPGAGSQGSGGDSGNSGSSSSNSPLSGSSSYVDIIMNAGLQSGVNPYVLAAMIIQEQGKAGTSPLISGKHSGYEGYYNFFNVEAYQSGSMSAIQRGLWYASQSGSYGRPWNSVEQSILGGSLSYGANYVKAGQDTFYLKKFNVQGNNLYKHQYMTNIQGAASEGAIYAAAYSQELKQTALQFKIPVYKNMPENPSPKPNTDGSPNNKLSSLGVNGLALTPTFNKDVTSYDLIVDTSVSEVTISASVLDSKASISGGGTVNLQSGINDIKVSVKAQNGAVREYVIRVVRRQNGPTHDSSVKSQPAGETNKGGESGGPGAVGPGTVGSGAAGSGAAGSGTAEPGAAGPGAGGTEPGQGTSGGNGPGGSSVTIVQ